MAGTILIAYATRYGSTKEVAETITAIMTEKGLAVDLQPVNKVRKLEGYGAVLLGTPIYIGRLHKEARRFLLQNHKVLSERPLVIFALGPIRDEPEDLQQARIQLENDIAKFSLLTPTTLEVFAGKYDPQTLRFPDSLLAKLPVSPLYKHPACDARNWTAIRSWAEHLATSLASKLAQEEKS